MGHGRLWVNEFRKVIGKRISGLVVARHPESPKSQVFLIFDDGTSYELYGTDIYGAGGIDREGLKEIRLHLLRRQGIDILLDGGEQTKTVES